MPPQTRGQKQKLNAPLKSVRQNGMYLARVPLVDRGALMELNEFHLDYACMPQAPDGKSLQFYAPGSAIRALQKSGREVEVLADAEVESRRMQALVNKGDRFQGGETGPEGVGKLI